MSRLKATAIHLSISFVVAAIVGVVLYFLWYPAPFFIAAGASVLMLLLMGVDVCIGPLLTSIVFSPAKKRSALRFDIAVIAVLQTAAFAYGTYVICQARPVFIVGEVDRLVLIAAEEIDDKDLAKATLPQAQSISWTGPKLIGVIPPTGPEVYDLVVQAMQDGKTISQMPQLYVPYPEVTQGLLKHAQALSHLRGLSAEQQKQVEDLLAHARNGGYELVFLPLERHDHFYTAILRKDTALPLDVLDLDPWESSSMQATEHP